MIQTFCSTGNNSRSNKLGYIDSADCQLITSPIIDWLLLGFILVVASARIPPVARTDLWRFGVGVRPE